MNLKLEYVSYEKGVRGCVITALNAFCSQGNPVFLHSATYVGVTENLSRNGYKIVLSPLIQDENYIWRMDYEDMN